MKYKSPNHISKEDSNRSASSSGGKTAPSSKELTPTTTTQLTRTNSTTNNSETNNHGTSNLPPSKKYFRVHILRKFFKKYDGGSNSAKNQQQAKNRRRTNSVPSIARTPAPVDDVEPRSSSLIYTSNGDTNNQAAAVATLDSGFGDSTPSLTDVPMSSQQAPPTSEACTTMAASSDYETASEDGNRRDDDRPSPPPMTNNFPPSSPSPTPNSMESPNAPPMTSTPMKLEEDKLLRQFPPKESSKTNHRPNKIPKGGAGAHGTREAGLSDDPKVALAYNALPLLEITKLPRGGISMETEAVGRVQFGIPPETIKDSMRLGLGVPTVYIVPTERFCREMGPALGVNLAEFEFPAYFNFFVLKRRCTLIVDSEDAESNIRKVFGETLLGPAPFRRKENPVTYAEEDFAPNFPRAAIPDFEKELKHFRIMPDGKELVIETLLKFTHFVNQSALKESGMFEKLGVPDVTQVQEKEAEGMGLEVTEEGWESGGNGGVVGADVRAVNLQMESDDEIEHPNKKRTWVFAEPKNIGDVATVFPTDATPEQIKNRTVPRVEIFKLPGGTEYIVHDINADNRIIARARFSGHVRVSEGMKIAGFTSNLPDDDNLEDEANKSSTFSSDDEDENGTPSRPVVPALPPSFHPPSFGVTVLGNSHGFDKSGSTSGYVLWVNGRGIMIDPPPYSSATLEREGIRPRTIVGIILTHCHADHDAGAFQKVLTGSPVVVITTPTIYKSFIRKYAALSALSPALLRHSHRHKPAIIGTPLRFQGATFYFTYTLHTIPCVGFKVEWRGRSMVFTGDHFNSPPAIEKLQESGVLSKARADDLTNLPLQETDLLLHEAGAPPIHTPLDVLLKLPAEVKQRLYVVHTSALPEGCELRVAPTGTAGTIRLDQLRHEEQNQHSTNDTRGSNKGLKMLMMVDEDRELDYSQYNTTRESETSMLLGSAALSSRDVMGGVDRTLGVSMVDNGAMNIETHANMLSDENVGSTRGLPLAALRPTSSTDAWFTLNLLSSVPFLTSLSYATTMEVLETAQVSAYCMNDIVVPASRRRDLLCVVWEGTCMEREPSSSKMKPPARRSRRNRVKNEDRRFSTFSADSATGTYEPITERELKSKKRPVAVWHAGDWTGPRALQPEKRLSGESSTSKTHDIVAMSSEGVKVIIIEFSSLHSILKSGSPLYRKYLARKERKAAASNALLSRASSSMAEDTPTASLPSTPATMLAQAVEHLNLIELFDHNSAFRRLSAVQKRHLESLAEGPILFKPGERLWRAGATVDKAFIVVAGMAAFVPKRRNAGSVGLAPGKFTDQKWDGSGKYISGVMDENDDSMIENLSLGQRMKRDAIRVIRDMESQGDKAADSDDELDSTHSLTSHEDDAHTENVDFYVSDHPPTRGDSTDFSRLAKSLRKRADIHHKPAPPHVAKQRRSSSSEDHDMTDSRRGSDASSTHDNTFFEGEDERCFDSNDSMNLEVGSNVSSKTGKKKRNSSRDRYTNKVLGRLYSRRAFTSGLVFSRGHFLGDVSKMVAGLLSDEYKNEQDNGDDSSFNYGFGDQAEGKSSEKTGDNIGDLTIHEREGDQLVVHSSTLAAGRDGCAVIFFPKPSLIPFLDEYPGLLLSLLGTQVVV